MQINKAYELLIQNESRLANLAWASESPDEHESPPEPSVWDSAIPDPEAAPTYDTTGSSTDMSVDPESEPDAIVYEPADAESRRIPSEPRRPTHASGEQHLFLTFVATGAVVGLAWLILLHIMHGHLSGPDTQLSNVSIPLRIVGIGCVVIAFGGVALMAWLLWLMVKKFFE